MNAPRRFKIAAIPADGVGQEVVAAGREVLDALAAGSAGAFAFDWQEFDRQPAPVLAGARTHAPVPTQDRLRARRRG